MTLAITDHPVPLKADPYGAVRVGGTSVLLDTVVAAFRNGASAEQIVEQYPVLNLADVYSVIAYYLRDTASVDVYLDERRQEADRLRLATARYARPGIRERLLARQRAGG